jgi:hypothetical protein
MEQSTTISEITSVFASYRRIRRFTRSQPFLQRIRVTASRSKQTEQPGLAGAVLSGEQLHFASTVRPGYRREFHDRVSKGRKVPKCDMCDPHK